MSPGVAFTGKVICRASFLPLLFLGPLLWVEWKERAHKAEMVVRNSPRPPAPELQLLHRWPLPASSAPHVKALTVCLTHKVGLVATSLSHWALTVPWRKGTVKSGCGSCFVASLKVRMTHLLFYARDDKRYWMCWRWQINAELMALAEEVIGGLQNQS